jgi:hypothetical protein
LAAIAITVVAMRLNSRTYGISSYIARVMDALSGSAHLPTRHAQRETRNPVAAEDRMPLAIKHRRE